MSNIRGGEAKEERKSNFKVINKKTAKDCKVVPCMVLYGNNWVILLILQSYIGLIILSKCLKQGKKETETFYIA